MMQPATLREHLRGLLDARPAGANDGALSDDNLHGLAKAIVPFVREVVATAVAARDARIAALEAELAAMKEKMLTDGDIWDAETAYPANAVTTHGGNLWLAKQANVNEPPGTSDAWRLMNKTKGRR
jgi:hypothetical protein